MKDCVFEELVGEVTNDNLVKFNKISVSFGGGQSGYYFDIQNSVNPTTITLPTGLTTSGGGSSIYFDGRGVVPITDKSLVGSGIIEIPNKYNVRFLCVRNSDASKNCDVQVKGLGYMPLLTKIEIVKNNYINESDVLNIIKGCPNLTYIQLSSNNGRTLYLNSNDFKDRQYSVILSENSFFSGECSDMPSSLTYLSCTGAMTWKTTRSSSSKIIVMPNGTNFGDDLDAMLINQANCTYTEASGLLKWMAVRGNCSFSSEVNAAIATLKGYGLTVYINGVQQ